MVVYFTIIMIVVCHVEQAQSSQSQGVDQEDSNYFVSKKISVSVSCDKMVSVKDQDVPKK